MGSNTPTKGSSSRRVPHREVSVKGHRSTRYQQAVNTKHIFRFVGHISHDTMPSKTFDLKPETGSVEARWLIVCHPTAR